MGGLSSDVERIKRYRLEHDLTWIEVAAAIGIGVATLHKFVRKPDSVHYDRTAFKIGKFLDRVDQAAADVARTAAPRRRARMGGA